VNLSTPSLIVGISSGSPKKSSISGGYVHSGSGDAGSSTMGSKSLVWLLDPENGLASRIDSGVLLETRLSVSPVIL
jgi:hypothetical protein